MLSDSCPFRYSPSLQLRVFLETISSSVASPLSPCVGCVNSYIIRKKQQKTGTSVRALNLSVQWYNGGNPVCCSALKCKENSGADISCLMYPANIRSQVYLQVNFCTTKTLKFDLLIHCWQESKCTVKVKRKYTKQNFFLSTDPDKDFLLLLGLVIDAQRAVFLWGGFLHSACTHGPPPPTKQLNSMG